MNRREFLRPRNLLRPAGHVLGAVDELRALEDDLSESAGADAVLLQFARRAMATTFEVILPFGTPQAQEMAEAGFATIDALESQLTVYREDSEVSRLNAAASHAPIDVQENLFNLLVVAQELFRQTEGAFDIAVGALVKTWGFYRRAGRVPASDELAAVRDQVGMNKVVLDLEKRTVTFTRPGLEINLGSIGKGYTLDRVGRDLRQAWSCTSSLLHGGHSSVLALGNEPGASDGWTVGILDPVHTSERLTVLKLKDRGLGTSAATYQSLEYQGRKLPHLLDPRTLWPAEGMQQASVTAPSAAVADALATAFFILGVEKARAYCESHPDIGAVLLDAERRLAVLGRCRDEVL